MDTGYRTFRNWDNVDCEEYYFMGDRRIDDPELNQDDVSRRDAEEFDDSDDFHKYDDTDEAQQSDQDDADTAANEGRFNGTIGI